MTSKGQTCHVRSELNKDISHVQFVAGRAAIISSVKKFFFFCCLSFKEIRKNYICPQENAAK